MYSYDEVHLVFDRYDFGESLKTSTRERILGVNKAVAYHITDSTSMAKVTMHNSLAHIKTKDELITCLAHKVLEYAKTNGKNVVWHGEVKQKPITDR